MTKAPEEQIAQAMNAAGPVPSALRVTVPPELQGVAFISVLCQKGKMCKPFVKHNIAFNQLDNPTSFNHVMGINP